MNARHFYNRVFEQRLDEEQHQQAAEDDVRNSRQASGQRQTPCACQGRIQDLKLGGCEMWSGRSSAEDTRMETGVGSWEGLCPLPRKILACSPSKWCILMDSGACFRPTIIATTMFVTLAEVYYTLIKIMTITVCAMRTIKGVFRIWS